MRFFIDVGSSTVKVYIHEKEKLTLCKAKTFQFRKDFDPQNGISKTNLDLLYAFFDELITMYGLSNKNTKLFATGVFRDFQCKQAFVEEFYVRTKLYFNIISHELEAFYLEKACGANVAYASNVMVINIGGKTTELILYCHGKVKEKIKLQIGVGTLLNEFGTINNNFSAVGLDEVVSFATKLLPRVDIRIDAAIYTGGELDYMRIAGYPLRNNTLFKDNNHPSMISLQEFKAHNQRIFFDISIDELRNLMPQNPEWMNGARACSALSQAICEHNNVPLLIPSNSNLIDGVCVQEAKSVVICGSFNKHLKEITMLISDLQSKGVDVLSPRNTRVVGKQDSFVLFQNDLIVNHSTFSVEMHHLEAIEKCDMVIICNFGGYIGNKTAMEIGYAYRCGKKIVFIEDNPSVQDIDIPSDIYLV